MRDWHWHHCSLESDKIRIRPDREVEHRTKRGLLNRRLVNPLVPVRAEWLKSLFEIEDRVWYRGLENYQTQLLAALFAYQVLIRYNHRKGYENGQIRWMSGSLEFPDALK